MNKKMEKAFNKQINAEIYSSYLYYAMEAYFQSKNLKGCATWMHYQAMEELIHVIKFSEYINNRGGRVKLEAIEAPQFEWDSPLAAFEAAYAHEQKVSGLINKLVDLAKEESDHASDALLQWFVTEQVEEEATVDEIVQNFKIAGDSGPGLFMIDQQLGQRTPPAPPAA